MTLPISGRLGIGYLGTTAIATGAGVTTAGTMRVVVASDSAATLPSGAATSAKQDEQTALLTSIAGYVDGLEGFVDGLETSLAAISGYVDGLEASLTTIVGHVDGLEGLLTTLGGYVDGLEGLLTGVASGTKQDTGNASLASIDGKMTACNTGAVTISAALPAGTNAIGKLAANTGVIIGAVEIAAAQTVAVTNAGTFAVQVDGAALTSLQLIDDVIYTDDAAFTPGTSKIAGIGLQADETGTDSVDEGDVGCPRMTLDRKTITSPQPHTAGGCSAAAFLSDGATKAGVIKNAAGQIYGLSVGNANAAACYVRLYNMTTNPATTDTPVYRFLIPGGSAGAGREKTWPLGMAFSTGIAYRITTGAADNNDTAAASAEVTANFDYK